MPHSRFSFFTPFVCAIVIVVAAFSVDAQATEWRECENAKLRALKLQRDSGNTTKAKKKQRASRNERIEEIDTWLWKNCREFSYELRQLEQEKM